ncbi:HutD family protein [Mesorhizobium sp. SB112]|uniref:HutD/Ves family protein n=1 Tax=Mesorhizobium sp. SB112 TaxID=3151853 RepID=UPI0032646433
MRIIRAADHQVMPWKNGGGQTAEIAVFPADAALADFGWRISMATVASDGPFSVFEGIDRTLTVLEGAGLILAIEGQPRHTLTTSSAPLFFAADAATNSSLIDGTVTDLNVMTRRRRYTHSVRRLDIERDTSLTISASTTLIFCASGNLEVESQTLSRFDAIVLENAQNLDLRPHDRASLIVIEIDPAA